MIEYIHKGRVIRGKFLPDFPAEFENDLIRFNDKIVYLSIGKETRSVTVQQHRYYRGVICKKISDQIGGYTPTQIHEILAFKFLKEIHEDTQLEYIRSTKDLTTEEMASYIEECISWANDIGVDIPPAEKVRLK